MTDTHAHLNDPLFDSDIPAVLERSAANGVRYIIVCGWDIPSSERAVALAGSYDSVYAAAGVHPHDSPSWSSQTEQALLGLLQDNKVVALGEIGLDYYYDLEFKELQQACFRQQLAIALERRIPVSIHSRQAMKDTIAILKEYRGITGVLHFFTGDRDDLKELLNMGLFIGADGPLTFKSSSDLRSVIKDAPEDRILLETDCPYMAPVPFRGKRCEPYMVRHILEYLAELRQTDPLVLKETIRSNTYRLFGIGP